MRFKFNDGNIQLGASLRTGGLALLLGVLVSSLPRPVLAQEPAAPEAADDEKQVCSQSFEEAQRLRNDTSYIAANQELLKCANPKCGEALFQECSRLYDELQAAMPSVVFDARDANGQELSDVTVTLDGKTLTEELDGKPVVVDPGSHTFTFVAPNAAPTEKSVVVRAGEKFRQVSAVIELKADKPSVAAPDAPAHAKRARHPHDLHPLPVGSYVLGGVGIVALGAFAVLRVIGGDDYQSLQDRCAPTCSQSDVDSVKQKFLMSNIALGVSAAAVVGAVVLYETAPTPGSGAGTAFVVSPVGSGVLARAVTRF